MIASCKLKTNNDKRNSNTEKLNNHFKYINFNTYFRSNTDQLFLTIRHRHECEEQCEYLTYLVSQDDKTKTK